MKNDTVHLACAIMLKNESDVIHYTLNSIYKYIDSLVIYDTGSTDNTLDLIREFCDRESITLRLKCGEFVDFATSRNIMLDFVDTFEEIDFVLLLDANEEIKNGKELRKYCLKQKHKNDIAYSVDVSCLINDPISNRDVEIFQNVKLIKPRNNLRYKGVVHEYIDCKNLIKAVGFEVFQDREHDKHKTINRFDRDRELLEAEVKKDPEDNRTLFYLAQTYRCLHEDELALEIYKKIVKLNTAIQEYLYFSNFMIGELSTLLYDDWKTALFYYHQAFNLMRRAEPLVRIAQYYFNENNHLCFMYCQMACYLPISKLLTLGHDIVVHDYLRWKYLYASAPECGHPNIGLEACRIACKSKYAQPEDFENLKMFEKTT